LKNTQESHILVSISTTSASQAFGIQQQLGSVVQATVVVVERVQSQLGFQQQISQVVSLTHWA
jgi:hypothetical protein